MKRKLLLASACGVCLILGTIQVIRLRQPLSTRSTQGLDAMLRGDAKTLMAFASDREKAEEGLTQQKLQAVLDRLVVPYIGQVDRSKPPETADDTGDFHALSQRIVIASNGSQVSMAFDVWLGDDGCTVPVLTSVLRNSWLLRFSPKANKSGKDLFAAALAGVQQDRPYLTSLGLSGLTNKDESKPLSSWKNVADHNRAILAIPSAPGRGAS